ncbi:type II toxin-antitoxin system VapB family antitoxin [Photorhabdus tasmaniensis]|uniref:AbrB/MazE/SpoVT family DNA-binding domain-containing protein n=1 Tax=Photorhabdus tasmaniensis TaxID=1004159 RepID=A0ABX0GGE6_9GAMM|nr:type II toxin-antitoxin system VapB family antitoxin [Photorhabdus tasmaniensis]NHB88225.1 AbrB/MazE/SpoVT family DNA-binding domain-containing protein [Photorhabdus tasmaniensis]
MYSSKVFISNRTQNVRIPADVRFPDNVKNVTVRAIGKERIISPIENVWDSFFMSDERPTDDFLPERASQHQSEREAF